MCKHPATGACGKSHAQHQSQVLHCGAAGTFAQVVQARNDHRGLPVCSLAGNNSSLLVSVSVSAASFKSSVEGSTLLAAQASLVGLWWATSASCRSLALRAPGSKSRCSGNCTSMPWRKLPTAR